MPGGLDYVAAPDGISLNYKPYPVEHSDTKSTAAPAIFSIAFATVPSPYTFAISIHLPTLT